MRALTALFVVASAAPVTLATCQGPPCHQAGAAREARFVERVREEGFAAVGAVEVARDRVVCLGSDRDHDALGVARIGELEGGGTGCVARAYRPHGQLWERSEPRWIAEEADLGAPFVFHGRDAGLGIEFTEARDDGAPPGVRVLRVVSGGPSDGRLRPGDRILAVDGHETLDPTRWSFIDVGTGPAGSVAVLEVGGPEGTRTVEIVRAPIVTR